MQLEALKVFCDVVRWASFSRGAAENGVAQSSASQTVQRLEEHLGVRLIDRSKRPLVLTPQGKLFYEGCKELVGRYQELELRVRSFDSEAQLVGTVRVASIYSVGLAHMDHYVRTFHEAHPEVDVRLEYLHPTRVTEAVTQGLADLGLVSFPRKWPDLTVIPWREEPMVVACAPTHPLARCQTIQVGQLDGATIVSFDPELSIRRAIDRYLKSHGVQVRVGLLFDNIEHIKRAVEVRSGLAILPEPTLVEEVRSGTLVAIPLADPSLTRPLAIVRRRAGVPDLATSRFLDWLLADGATTGAAPAPPPLSRNR
jgi:DNA-binding transcriptional LysR family regulator